MTHRILNLVRGAIYLALAWAALTALLYLGPWAPAEFAFSAARALAIGVAAIVLILSALGAVFALLGLFVVAVEEPARRPYVSVQ